MAGITPRGQASSGRIAGPSQPVSDSLARGSVRTLAGRRSEVHGRRERNHPRGSRRGPATNGLDLRDHAPDGRGPLSDRGSPSHEHDRSLAMCRGPAGRCRRAIPILDGAARGLHHQTPCGPQLAAIHGIPPGKCLVFRIPMGRCCGGSGPPRCSFRRRSSLRT
jgi:hypothetical protein